MKRYAYVNGKIVPADKVTLPVTDIGVLRGFGIFDWIKAHHGIPILGQEHIARFMRSAKAMGLTVPMNAEKIATTIDDLLQRYKAPLAGIRLILTGGTAQGLSYEPGKETFIILIEELKSLPEELYTKGGRLITFEHERIFPEVKSLNYITAVKLQKERLKKKAIEILYTYQGKVLEATTSNFFMIKGNTLITSSNKILIGTTRNHVLKLARKAGFTIEERDIMLDELFVADEAFITASNKEVLPIVAIDGKKIGNGKVGQKTQLLMNHYKKSLDAYVRSRYPRN
jgi:branched-subunit amino acid aminotransferase/4-amino-4-deoxychorismate lyase